MSELLIERPGLLTTVQDPGRWGYQHLGVPVSGWMDAWSARLANRLVGNLDAAATLEVTWLGPVLRLERAAMAAITGARFEVRVGGELLATPLVRRVPADSTIEFGRRLAGTRAYVAFAGGISTPLVLGSRSTDLRSQLGGLDGRRLQSGDRLPLGVPTSAHLPVPHDVPDAEWLFDSAAIRVVPGVGRSDWSHKAYDGLCRSQWRLTAASDRTGYRLEPIDGSLTIVAASGETVSQPVTTGAIQLPPSGHPLVLMADRQTTGGYPVIAVVAAADLPVVGQLGPGDVCRFVPCTWREAEMADRARARLLDQVAKRGG